jgi:tetraacyldisaccharide-1-P 4'-kinase
MYFSGRAHSINFSQVEAHAASAADFVSLADHSNFKSEQFGTLIDGKNGVQGIS